MNFKMIINIELVSNIIVYIKLAGDFIRYFQKIEVVDVWLIK